MPHRRPKPSIVLGAVTALAVASPMAVYSGNGPSVISSTSETSDTVIPTEIAQVVLEQIPDVVIPLKELTGLNLPDINIGDLRNLEIPPSIRIPSSLELPGGVQIPLEIPGLGDVSDPATPPPADQEPGTIVKEVFRDTPFSMVALTSETVGAAESKVRAMKPDGTWGEWFTPEIADTDSARLEATGGKVATEPVYVGQTNAIQVLTPTPTSADAEAALANAHSHSAPAAPEDPAPAPGASEDTAPSGTTPEAAAPLGYTPASVSKPLRQQSADTAADWVTAVLISPGSSAGDSLLTGITNSLGSLTPGVISRGQWGADESMRCSTPTYDNSLGGAVVHHTAGTNNYSPAESAQIVRGIYAYHAQTLGWCDIGYNALVDRYGQIFEGRAGGLGLPVRGAHAGGFNENTTGVAMLGDFSNVAPPQATIDAVGRFLGWKLGNAGLDPFGYTRMYSEGTQFTPIPIGQPIDLPVIFAHSDVGYTVCPGAVGYQHMNEIRQIAAANLGNGSSILAAGPPVGSVVPDVGSSLPDDIPGLVTELIRLSDSPVVQKWLAEGGEAGRLGQAITGLLRAKAGNTGALFTNGAIYTSPNGGAWTVLGEIYNTWKELGSDMSALGLPTSDEYPIPGGMRSDFENGSLIFNELTGAVTEVLETYNDTYEQVYEGGARSDASAPVPPSVVAPSGSPTPVAPG
ncbi:cold-shock protein [Rhodococcus sp. WMMA185]|uniref:N-acetylmuramoyl-L-alanine amidase n=1 Tax=Rhodococcus sp. WMMA185 TaxID=679318 RepID=UPI000878EEDA|nr:N-acetylmuramoyl-L-alanine amidase [Rhodococcus sp. WMMA185]AOW93801.1 cold-shock protein [Rhodococcus sp. WMMA185]